MLERASACLDSGVRLSLRAQRRALKSRRLLHSSFWHHSANDIELPVCLVSSACPPTQQCFRAESQRCSCPRPHHPLPAPHANPSTQAHHACPSHVTAQSEPPPFLDFLYPAQTLAFMTRVPASHLDRIWDRRAARRASANGLRGYSSMTPASQDHQPSASPLLTSATSSYRLAQDLSLLMSDNPEGPESDQVVQRAWDLFVTLPDNEQTPEIVNNLISWLAKLPTRTANTRLLDLFARLPTANRSAAAYHNAVSANISTGRVDEALELFTQGTALMPHELLGADLLMLHAVTNHDWDMAVRICYRCQRRHTRPPGFTRLPVSLQITSHRPPPRIFRTPTELWAKLGTDPNLDSHLLTLAELYMQTLDNSTRSLELREIIEAIWRARVRYSLHHDPLFLRRGVPGRSPRSSLKKLFVRLHDLNLSSPQIYESAILQLINAGPSGPLDDISALVNFIFEQYKQSPVFSPSMLLLVRMVYLWRHCSLSLGAKMPQSTGIQVQVFVQYMERFYGQMDLSSAVTIMDGMARLGNIKGVEEYARKYLALHPQGLENASDLYPLVYVHAKRADPDGALNQLLRIESEFGVAPSLRCWNIVIHAYEVADDLDGAVNTLEQLLKTDLEPDAYTFGPVMNLYAKQGDVDSTTQLLKDAVSRNIEPTVHMLNSVIVAHVNNDDMEQAEQSLQEAVEAVNEGEAKGSLTICYNTLLTAYALHRNIDLTMATYRRMKDQGVPLDSKTYAALIQALCLFRQSHAGIKIIRKVMPKNHVTPRAFHYNLVIAGFVNQENYTYALAMGRDMVRSGVRPTASTQAALMKARALYEHESLGGDLTYYDGLSRVPLEKAIEDFEALCESGTGVPARADQSQSSSALSLHADFLVFLHGKRCAFEAARSILEKYMTKVFDTGNNSQDSPPIRLITALMSVHLRAREYEEVDRYWELAKSLADAQRFAYSKQQALAGRVVSDSAEQEAQTEPLISPSSRFMLSRPLRYYMASQFSQESVPASSKMPALISSLSSLGFQFDNRTWNALIVHLCRTTPPRALLAFTLTEKFLIANWSGWIKAKGGVVTNRTIFPKLSSLAGGVQYLRNVINTRYRSHGTLIPQYKTMVYLASALLELRNLEATGSLVEVIRNNVKKDEAGQSEVFRQVGSLREIREVASSTMAAAQGMPMVFDRLQQKVIRRE